MNKNNLNIFNNIKNKNLRLTPLKNRKNYLGNINYFTPVAKEWKNVMYAYNKNNSTILPTNVISVNELVQMYFNFGLNRKFLYKKYKPRWVTRPSMNRIYVSNAEIKHSHSKTIITLHSYNRERIALMNKIKYLRKELLKKIKLLIFKNKELLGDVTKKTIKVFLDKELKILRRYKLRLHLNSYKFEEKLLHKLTNILEYYYNKKVEFNIVNMKSVILSSDIFTKVLGEKLWKRKNPILKMFTYILSKAVLPRVNRNLEKSQILRSVDFNLIHNKYRNVLISSVIQNNDLNTILKEEYNNIMSNNNIDKDFDNMHETIFNSIRYKNMGGVRLEVRGRLSKLNQAGRSSFKVKWKGGLKNVYSSYKGLPVSKIRGYINPNVEQAMLVSGRGAGAFAIKGWVSGK